MFSSALQNGAMHQLFRTAAKVGLSITVDAARKHLGTLEGKAQADRVARKVIDVAKEAVATAKGVAKTVKDDKAAGTAFIANPLFLRPSVVPRLIGEKRAAKNPPSEGRP